MMQLPPDDRPDTISIGPVEGIPIIHDDDPRFEVERADWSRARAKAQAMHTPDELLDGTEDPHWRVRHEVIDRLVARAGADPRTLPRLLWLLAEDPAWEVRDAVAMTLYRFDPGLVVPALRRATGDSCADVRRAAEYSLAQVEPVTDDT